MAAPYGKRSVVLRGNPIVNEDGVAGSSDQAGLPRQGRDHGQPADVDAATVIPKTFALERSELGTGIDSTYTGTNNGTGSPDYASGDQVKVGAFHAGCRVTAWVASGQVIAADGLLSSAGDGTLEALDASDYPVARALEAVTAVALTKIRIEIRLNRFRGVRRLVNKFASKERRHNGEKPENARHAQGRIRPSCGAGRNEPRG
jgi:hypothetical protein